jgi:predicted acetyltransferase
MNVSIDLIQFEEKDVLRNLMEKYDYEFSQYLDSDVNNFGLYGYKYLDHYWTDENRFAYFIKVNNKLAGFIMINNHGDIKQETDNSIAEFFVMYKYRKLGVGTYAMKYVFNKFKGKWQIGYTPKNKIAKIFWNKIVSEYTQGNYKLYNENIDHIYEDGTMGEVLVFEI